MATLTVRNNPYIIGPPISDPKRFFGRTSLFDFVRSNLLSGARVILLHGQRRIGKSSVLAQIPAIEGLADFVFASLDLQYVSNEPLWAILHKLGLAIAAAAEKAGAVVTPLSAEELRQDEQSFLRVFLPRVQAALGYRQLVLLLDEFDVVGDQRAPAASEPFFSYLRSALNQVRLIAVVGRRVDDLGDMRQLFHEAPSQEIGLLDRESAVELITRPAESMIKFRPPAIDAILELSAGHPYFTQLLAYALFQRAEQRKQFVVEREDVEAAVGKAMESGLPGLAWFHSGLPVEERVMFSAVSDCQEKTGGGQREQVLMVLAGVGIVVTEALERAVVRLLDWGFVQRVGPEPLPVFRVTVELVRRWMVRYHPLRKEIEDLEITIPEASQKYAEAQAARATGSGQAYGLYKDAVALNPNHFSAVLEMAELASALGNFGEAAQAYQRLYLSDPTPRNAERYAVALLEAAKQDLSAGDFVSAGRNANDALRYDAENQDAQMVWEAAEAQRLRALAARNPFIVGPPVPPSEFTGRKKEVGLVLSAIGRRGHVVLFGERRMGKTSLLQYIASPNAWRGASFSPDAVFSVYVDCSSVRSFSAAALWQEIAARVQTRLAESGNSSLAPDTLPGIDDKSPSTMNPYIAMAGQALAARGRRMVLLLDEFDGALAMAGGQWEALTTQLRRLATASPGGASLILAMRRSPAGAQEPASVVSPWYNIFRLVPVARLEPEEVSELVQKMPYPLTDDEAIWLRETAERYPFPLSCGLSLLFQWHAAGRRFEVLEVTQELFDETNSFFASLWSGATATEKGVMALAAIRDCELRLGNRFSGFDGFDMAIARRRQVLRELQERGLMGKTPNRYSLGSSLLELWIMQELEALSPRDTEELASSFRELSGPHVADELLAALREIAARQVTRDIRPWTHPVLEG
jgi:tetratricopeptide (TPR) repeat protein